MHCLCLDGANKGFSIQYLAIGALVLFLLTACSAQSATPPSVPSATATRERQELGQWRIRLSISGGFAGLRRSAELSSTGELTVTDQKRNKKVTVQVPQAEMERISSWVLQARPTQPQPRLSNCRDCFEYELTILRDGEILSFWFNDVTLEDAELAPLVNTLARLQEQALSGQLNP